MVRIGKFVTTYLAGTHNILHSTPPTLVLSASPMPYAEPNLPRIHVVEFKGFLGRFKYLANLRFEYAPVTAISTASQSSFYGPVVPCTGKIYPPVIATKKTKDYFQADTQGILAHARNHYVIHRPNSHSVQELLCESVQTQG